ncbi:MAG: cytochrome P450 [Verrucomicrobiota bacterium]|nr:cytochrome P450 [Verrucomicrobiota bacterium]
MQPFSWLGHFSRQVLGKNPFGGNSPPTRVSLIGRGRPTLPVPLPWNYKEPLKIFEAFYTGAAREDGWGKHNRYLYAGGIAPVLVTRDPGMIRAIQAMTGDKPGQFDRDTSPTAGIARATGEDSLLYSNGSIWRRQKSLVAKPFSRGNLFQLHRFAGFEQTFRNTVTARLDVLRQRQLETGQSRLRVELDPEIKVIMLEMLVNNFFGGSVSYDELRERYVPALVYLIDHMVRDTVAPRSQAFGRLLTGENRLLERYRKAFDALTDIALSGRKKKSGLWAEFASEAPDADLRSNIMVFLAGAMEATTSFASWAISHLSHSPEWQSKVYSEVKTMDYYDPDDFAGAPNLNRVLEETLRLTPALYFLPRRAVVDTLVETKDGRTMLIPKGTHIRLDVWHANRCEEFWGEQVTGYPADRFAPERWTAMEEKGLSPKEMLHFGFGYGPRFCPGRSLGLLEVGLVVGAMVKLFKFEAVSGQTGAIAGVSTKPADNVEVELELRGQG